MEQGPKTPHILISGGEQTPLRPDDMKGLTALNLNKKQLSMMDRVPASEMQNRKKYLCFLQTETNRPTPRQLMDLRTLTPMGLNTSET